MPSNCVTQLDPGLAVQYDIHSCDAVVLQSTTTSSGVAQKLGHRAFRHKFNPTSRVPWYHHGKIHIIQNYCLCSNWISEEKGTGACIGWQSNDGIQVTYYQ